MGTRNLHTKPKGDKTLTAKTYFAKQISVPNPRGKIKMPSQILHLEFNQPISSYRQNPVLHLILHEKLSHVR